MYFFSLKIKIKIRIRPYSVSAATVGYLEYVTVFNRLCNIQSMLSKVKYNCVFSKPIKIKLDMLDVS